MASVTSLDQDMKQLRLGRYTPQAANEIRRWIEEALGERLAPGDLMDVLRDGVALCKLINLAVSPGVRYKASNMPFVQMENISHFLRACELPPLSLPAHDRFLTVDLYDNKDPAQVLQCIAAFSRRASAVNPSAFPNTLGAKSKGASISPENTGPGSSPYTPRVSSYKTNTTGQSTKSPQASVFSGRSGSPTKSNSLSGGGLATGGPVSSWSKREDETKTAPAWNIHQYGYMGGASQGNQGVSFGARRQITSAAPEVPSLAEKEKRLRERQERERQEYAENEERIHVQRAAEEAEAEEEEQRRWEEETRRKREQRIRREEQAKNDLEAEQAMTESRNRQRTTSDARLNGQFLSQYNAGQTQQTPLPARPPPQIPSQSSGETQRIAELERQLAEMKAQAAQRDQQEQQAQREQEQQQQQRQTQTETETSSTATPTSPISTRPKPSLPTRPSHTIPPSYREDNNNNNDDNNQSATTERDYLRKAHEQYSYQSTTTATDTPTPTEPPQPPRPLPTAPSSISTSTSTRPLPPSTSKPKPPSSLLNREMERERARQREWEENQRITASAPRDTTGGSGPGQSWDVHQYGYMGGDNQNRGGAGLGVGGARRQIVGGPRPLPGSGSGGGGGGGGGS